MAAKDTKRATLAVPVTSGQYAPEIITLGRGASAPLLGVTALIESAPASATLELWLLRVGGDPDTDADYFYSGKSISSGSETWPLASWPGAQIRAKSGGTAGDMIVSAAAD